MQEPAKLAVTAEAAMPDSAPLLAEHPALAARLADTGYLYLRGVIDPDAIAWVRGEMIAALVEDGLLHPEALASHARGEIDTRWTGHAVSGVGIPGRQAQDAFQKRRIWETFAEMPEVRRVFEAVAGGPVTCLPISEYRSVAPGGRSPVHQDGTSNYGYDVHTAWFPVMPVDEHLGGVAVLPRTPERPYPLLRETADAPAELALERDWARADYRPGDMVVFTGETVHCACSTGPMTACACRSRSASRAPTRAALRSAGSSASTPTR